MSRFRLSPSGLKCLLTDSTSFLLPCSTSLDANNHAARAWGARPAAGGSSGAAVMAASRAGTLNQMLDADSDASDLEVDDDPLLDEGSGALRFKAVDLNDIGTVTSPDDTTLPPLTLPRDPKVVRTKIRRLQARKTERLKKEGESLDRDLPSFTLRGRETIALPLMTAAQI